MANGEQSTRISLMATVTRVLLSLICPAVATLLALVVLAPVGAQAGQPVKQAYTCPAGSFLTGFQGRAGDWLDQFQPVCGSWSPAAGSGGETHGDNFGNVNGGNRAVRSVCLPGSAIRGISFGMVDPNGWPGHLYNVFIRCAKLPAVSPDYADIPLDGPFGSNISGSFCGGHQVAEVAKGLVIGLDGINITSLELECDTVDNIVATAPSPAPTGQTLAPGVVANASGILKVLAPAFSITKIPREPCEHGLFNAAYQCFFFITITNTGLTPYTGPLTFSDVGGYLDGMVGVGGYQPFSCPSSRGDVTCSANVSLPPGGSVMAQAELDVPKEDAAKSACINAANSVVLTVPVQVGPVWTHSTLPAESGCLPNGTVTDGPVPPLCPAGWNQVVDPSRLPATYERQTVTLNGMSILCARRKISASDIIKLTQPPCPPLMHHDANGQCVGNPLIVPNDTAPPSGSQCRTGTVRIGRNCVATCPDGSLMPANRYCGPKIILRTPDQRLACPNGQLRDIHGNCPQIEPATCPFPEVGTPPNCHRVLIPKDTSQTQQLCPDGKTPMPKSGVSLCPAPPLLHLHRIFN